MTPSYLEGVPDGPGPGAARSRRRFLREAVGVSGLIATGGLVLDLTGCAGPDGAGRAGSTDTTPTTGDVRGAGAEPPATTLPSSPATLGAHDVLFALDAVASSGTPDQTVRRACTSLDWSWLDHGDSVFVKLAANSPHQHPSVTAPAAVRAVVAELYERGAGRVLVGDQSGVSYVRVAADGRRFGSTRACLRDNGLLEAITTAGAEPHLFDEADFHTGFFEAQAPPGSHWTQPLALPSVIREVDHVIYLPRISAHAIAGYTAGHKISIGWLREDSRNHLHSDAASFYEKYTEVNYVPELRDRFRLAIVLAEELLLHFGPDNGGTVVSADPRIVLAAADLAALDSVLSGLLVHLNKGTQPAAGVRPYSASTANGFNRSFVTRAVESSTGIPWGPATPADYRPLEAHHYEQGISADRALSRAWEIIGGRPEVINVVPSGAPVADDLAAAITAHGEGLVSFA